MSDYVTTEEAAREMQHLSLSAAENENTISREDSIDEFELSAFIHEVIGDAAASLGNVVINLDSISDPTLQDEDGQIVTGNDQASPNQDRCTEHELQVLAADDQHNITHVKCSEGADSLAQVVHVSTVDEDHSRQERYTGDVVVVTDPADEAHTSQHDRQLPSSSDSCTCIHQVNSGDDVQSAPINDSTSQSKPKDHKGLVAASHDDRCSLSQEKDKKPECQATCTNVDQSIPKKKKQKCFGWLKKGRRSSTVNPVTVKVRSNAFEDPCDIQPSFISKSGHVDAHGNEVFVINTTKLPKDTKDVADQLCTTAKVFIEQHLTTQRFSMVIHGGNDGSHAISNSCLPLARKVYKLLKENFAQQINSCIIYKGSIGLKAFVSLTRPFIQRDLRSKISLAGSPRRLVLHGIPDTVLLQD